MNNRKPVQIIGAIVLLLVFAWRFIASHGHSNGNTKISANQPENRTQQTIPASVAAHQQVISPDAHLLYTRHARCRMDCRHITENEIREVLEDGHVNEAKSDPAGTPCPTYAIEDDTREGQQLRIVFAKCDNEIKVVTCIDRGKEFECECK